MGSAFIEDGYTREDGYIADAPLSKSGERLWEALSFTYRVATRMEVVRHDAEVQQALRESENDPECAIKAELLSSAFVADHILRWDLKTNKNVGVIKSADACAKLHVSVFYRLYRIVRGTECSDAKIPTVSPPVSDEELQKN